MSASGIRGSCFLNGNQIGSAGITLADALGKRVQWAWFASLPTRFITATSGRHPALSPHFSQALDFTFVCPSEIIAFDKGLEKFEARNAQVLGVSVDWKNRADKLIL